LSQPDNKFPYDLITLGQFESGWGWEGQLRSYIRKKYRADLDGLAGLTPAAVAACLGAEIVPVRPYDTIRWGLVLKPFRPLELFFFYNVDPEFGNDLRVFFARKSLTVPTEDAYVFAWDFVALLARYGKGALPLALASAPGHRRWVTLTELDAHSGSAMERFTLQGRQDVLTRITPELVATAILRLDRGRCDATAGGWRVFWRVLPDLELRAECRPPQVEIAYEAAGAAKYGPDFLISFAWLYLNALLREARQVNPALPQLSSYF
jgi:hypothetical protein